MIKPHCIIMMQNEEFSYIEFGYHDNPLKLVKESESWDKAELNDFNHLTIKLERDVTERSDLMYGAEADQIAFFVVTNLLLGKVYTIRIYNNIDD